MPCFSGGISVAATETLVLKENSSRRRVLFVNDSANTIYLAKGDVAAANKGIRLNANGGSFEDLPDHSLYIWQGKWKAIAPAGASNLTWVEDT